MERKLKFKNDERALTFKDGHSSSYYYNTKEWRLLRQRYLMENPLCEECYKKGIIKAAKDIHHKIPFLRGKTEEQRIALLLDESNLMSLCKDCHLEKHGRREQKSLSDY